MIIATCLKCESGSSRFQPGKGPSRGLLLDYEPSCGPSCPALVSRPRLPVQFTLVMVGGLGLAVSVSTRAGSDSDPSLLAVNPSTDSSYSVAGSGTIHASCHVRGHVSPCWLLTQVADPGRGGGGVGDGLGLHAGGLQLGAGAGGASQVADVDSVAEQLRAQDVRVGGRSAAECRYIDRDCSR